MTLLPVIENCENCGACCLRTPIPPYQPGEEGRFEIPAERWQQITDRISADQQFDLQPCVWFNRDSRQCECYDIRPQACRDFEIGSDLCRLSRWDERIPDRPIERPHES
ncbi:MAG: YkgJ family cysteine cluster protein [Planctomycetaceae bacterium]|nr:YkgJ family cysteine cluster protein [Planctomycetaceae bacterium]